MGPINSSNREFSSEINIFPHLISEYGIYSISWNGIFIVCMYRVGWRWQEVLSDRKLPRLSLSNLFLDCGACSCGYSKQTVRPAY